MGSLIDFFDMYLWKTGLLGTSALTISFLWIIFRLFEIRFAGFISSCKAVNIVLIFFFFLTASKIKLKLRFSLLINLYNSSQISSAEDFLFSRLCRYKWMKKRIVRNSGKYSEIRCAAALFVYYCDLCLFLCYVSGSVSNAVFVSLPLSLGNSKSLAAKLRPVGLR